MISSCHPSVGFTRKCVQIWDSYTRTHDYEKVHYNTYVFLCFGFNLVPMFCQTNKITTDQRTKSKFVQNKRNRVRLELFEWYRKQSRTGNGNKRSLRRNEQRTIRGWITHTFLAAYDGESPHKRISLHFPCFTKLRVWKPLDGVDVNSFLVNNCLKYLEHFE